MPDNVHNAIVRLRGGKRLVRYALTSAALLRMIVPACCAAQVVDLPARGAHETVHGAAAASQMAGLSGSIPEAGRNLCRETGTQIGPSSALQTRHRTVLARSERQVRTLRSRYVRSRLVSCGCFRCRSGSGIESDPAFGQGSVGYGRRFGADFFGQTTWRFFTDFAYPTMFAEAPRYYRLIHGSGRRRFLHAVQHTFVAQRDSGKHMFNVSGWLGTATAIALNDVYHPGNERGLTPAMRTGGYALAAGMGFDILREFWPDIARKLRMPFRDAREPSVAETTR